MDLLDFIDHTNLIKKIEVEKAKLLMYYQQQSTNQIEFTMADIYNLFEHAGFSKPNSTRLLEKLINGKICSLNRKTKTLSFLIVPRQRLDKELNPLFSDNETLSSNSEFLDEEKFCVNRGYIDKIVKQINLSYKFNCWDACAVLTRRLFEITLILSYRNLNIEASIQNSDGTYFMLEKIVNNAIQNNTLKISRIKSEYGKFRKISNFAAHRIEYNSSKHDIDRIEDDFRAALEELYYKAGLIT